MSRSSSWARSIQLVRPHQSENFEIGPESVPVKVAGVLASGAARSRIGPILHTVITEVDSSLRDAMPDFEARRQPQTEGWVSFWLLLSLQRQILTLDGLISGVSGAARNSSSALHRLRHGRDTYPRDPLNTLDRGFLLLANTANCT